MQQPTEEVIGHLPLKEVAVLLVRHYGLHEGLFDLSLEMNLGLGSFGPSPAEKLPGAIVAIKAIGIVKVPQKGPQTVDAAEVNPAGVSSAKRAAKPPPLPRKRGAA